MNHVTFYRHKTWLIVVALLGLILLAACSPSATEAPPTAEPETVDTDVPPTAETEEETVEAEEPEETEDEAEISADSSFANGIIADTLPCEATIIPSSESTLSIRFREPTNDPSLMVGRLRPETALRIIEMAEVDGILWYRTVNPSNNTSFHWIEAQYIVLGDACVSGDGAAIDAEATEEMSSEATEAAMDEATEEATEESE